jgi:hypothetical protein
MRANRITSLLAAAAALLVLLGGYVHAREWLDTYRHVPGGVDGAFVVKVGFPVNAATSVVLAVALLACVVRWHRHLPLAVAATFAFEAASLATLILSRTGSVLGWAEPDWTNGANQARMVEVGALLALGALAAVLTARRRPALA